MQGENGGRMESAAALRPHGPAYMERPTGPAPEAENYNIQPEAAGWQRHWKVLFGHKLWIAVFCVLGAATGFAIFVPKPPIYEASTTLELQSINQSFMNIGSIDPLGGSFSDPSLNAQTQIAIIRSSSVVGPAFERMQRESSAVVAAPADRFSRLRSRLGILPKEPVQAFNDGLGMAGATLAVRIIPGTRIILISCESSVPEVAANFVNALAQEYMYQNQQSRSTNSQRTSQWLQGQLEETKARLEQAESKLQEFSRKSGNLFVSETDTLSNARLKQLQADLAAAQTERIDKESLYRASLTRPLEAFPADISSGLTSQQAEIDKLNAELAQLTTTLTANHYKVQRVQAQINQLEQARERERKNILTRLQSDYEEALNREKLLTNAYRTAAGAVSSEADKAAEYGSLKREVEILQQTLNSLLQQSNQTTVASAVPLQSARVIDPAKPAGFPTGPNLPRHIETGFMVGGLLGYVSAFLRDSLKQKRRRDRFGLPGYAAQLLNLPELGVIPSVTVKKRKKVRLLPRSANRPTKLIGPPSGNGDAAKSVELITWTEKPSLFAESFRLTLASLTISGRSSGSPRVIVVASAGPGEGKTTVATNIAIARAETNRRVLLLETDLRKPRLAKLLGLSNPKGWSDLILEAGEFKPDRLEALMQPTDIPGLFAMAGGTSAPESIHQVFTSPNVPLLLAAVRRQFDMVIIDTPPLLQFSEARLIGRLADGVVLVLRSAQTDRSAALACRQRLWEDGIPVLGTVLNDWDPESSEDPHYLRYYDGYHKYYSANVKE